MVRTPAALILVCALVGCAAPQRTPAPETPLRVEFLAWTLIPPEHVTFGRVGGLSGACFRAHTAYDDEADTWTTTPLDERARAPVEFASDSIDAPRLFHAGVALTKAGAGYELDVVLDYDEPLRGAADAEAVARLPVHHEGSRPGEWHATAFESPPTLLIREYAPDQPWQVRTRAAELPASVIEHARPNRSFESVALLEGPDGQPTVWLATESALTTDGDEATRSAGTRCVVLTGSPDTLAETHFYETDPMPPHIGPAFAIHSLVEFEALPSGEILALERSLTLPAGYGARLFVIDGGVRTERDARLPILEKRFIADLGTLARDAGVPWIGNLEGLALGPDISTLTNDPAETGRLLLVVADDNFGADVQKTGSQLIALRLLGY